MSDDIVRALGRVEGKLDGLSGHVDRLATQTELTREALEEQGKWLASRPCERHRREISNLHKAVGVAQENTGQIEMAEVRRMARWKMVKTAAKLVVGVAVVVAGTVGLLAYLGG